MSQPRRLLSLFTTVLGSQTHLDHPSLAYTGSPEVDEVIRTLPGLDLVRLLKHVRDWNSNARTCSIAQNVLHAILRLKTPEEILQAFEQATSIATSTTDDTGADGEDARPRKRTQPVMGLRELLDGLIPYSERHFSRIDRLVQDSYVLDYVVGGMDGGMFGDSMDVDGVAA